MVRSRQLQLAVDAVDLFPQFAQLLRRLFAEIGEQFVIDLLGHRLLSFVAIPLRRADPCSKIRSK